jgi:hypothetical protein
MAATYTGNHNERTGVAVIHVCNKVEGISLCVFGADWHYVGPSQRFPPMRHRSRILRWCVRSSSHNHTKTTICTSKSIMATTVKCIELPQLCVGYLLVTTWATSSLPARMGTVRTLENQAAAMILRVFFMMATELTARYQNDREASTRCGAQRFSGTTVLELVNRSQAKRA